LSKSIDLGIRPLFKNTMSVVNPKCWGEPNDVLFQ
jgi:hypothetical protein